MKKLSYFVSLACIVMFAGCSSDNDEVINEQEKPAAVKTVTIGVGMPGENDTRVEFKNELQDLVWSEGDVLTAENRDGMGRYRAADPEPTPFTILSGAGDKTAKFTGDIPTDVTDAPNFAFHYIGSKVTYTPSSFMFSEKPECKFDEQVQEGFNNTSHLKDHMFLKSNTLSKQSLIDGTAKVNMSAYNAILKINIKSLPAELLTATDFDLKWYVNYEPGMMAATKISLKNATFTEGGANNVYMAFDPNNILEPNSMIAFDIAANGKTYHAEALSTNGKNYEANRVYTVTLGEGSLAWTAVEGSVVEEIYGAIFNAAKAKTWTAEFNEGDAFSINTIPAFFPTQYMRLEGTGVAVSPIITLGKSNTVSVNSAVYNTAKVGPDYLGLLVRLSGTTTWTEIEGLEVGSAQVMVQTADLAVPADFEGKDVQFGFRCVSDPNMGDWLINSISVKGCI